MKHWVMLAALGLAACSSPRPERNASDTASGVGQSAASAPRRTLPPDSIASRAMTALRAKNGTALTALVHPDKGVRFSPYAHVDRDRDRHFTRQELERAWTSRDSLTLGSFDGSGDPIRLSAAQYLERFGNDLPAGVTPRVARDSEPMGRGNTINNVRAAYPGATVIEFHTPGVDPKYGGMDWRSVWVVLERSGNDWYVVGIVHGGWTI